MSFLGQYAGTGGAGGTNVGFLSTLRPTDGTPDSLTTVDLADGDNTNDGTINAPWTGGNPADGGWHHVAWVYDQDSGNLSHYIDYALAGSATIDTSTSDFDRNQVLQFGVRFLTNVNLEGATNEATLLLDETRYSDSALGTEDFLVAVPEPQSLVLLLGAGVALLVYRRR